MKESAETYALAAVGASRGLIEAFKPNVSGKQAWAGIAIGVLAHEVLCGQGETLSEQYDRWLENDRTKYLAIGAVAVVGSHLLNLIPERLDPLHQFTKLFK